MPTITDTLMQCAQDLRDAVAAVRNLYNDVLTAKNAAVAQTTTIINNFVNRPPQQIVWCDPINGNDANDGATITNPKKSIDAIIAAMGVNNTSIYLLNDGTMQVSGQVYAPLSIIGMQPSGSAPGYTQVPRTIRFLSEATNSPSLVGRYPSGFFMRGGNFYTSSINFSLPLVDASLNYRSHFTVTNDAAISLNNCTVLVDGAGSGALIGATSGRATLTAGGLALGAGATGHLCLGIAAGADPNSLYNYISNVKSA